MTIKELWEMADAEDGRLTLEQFEELAKENKVKFADVTSGDYVSVNKYNDELKSRDTQISTLNDTIAQRDTDLKDLQDKLGQAGTDATKLDEVSQNLTALQTKYDTDTKALQEKLQSRDTSSQ